MLTPKQLAQLIADLDSPAFKVRDAAMKRLTSVGVQAKPALEGWKELAYLQNGDSNERGVRPGGRGQRCCTSPAGKSLYRIRLNSKGSHLPPKK